MLAINTVFSKILLFVDRIQFLRFTILVTIISIFLNKNNLIYFAIKMIVLIWFYGFNQLPTSTWTRVDVSSFLCDTSLFRSTKYVDFSIPHPWITHVVGLFLAFFVFIIILRCFLILRSNGSPKPYGSRSIVILKELKTINESWKWPRAQIRCREQIWMMQTTSRVFGIHRNFNALALF